jgi:hypothetical protein
MAPPPIHGGGQRRYCPGRSLSNNPEFLGDLFPYLGEWAVPETRHQRDFRLSGERTKLLNKPRYDYSTKIFEFAQTQSTSVFRF